MTVGRLLREIDSQELTEWVAYYEVTAEGPEKKQQTPSESQAVLRSMVRSGTTFRARGKKRG